MSKLKIHIEENFRNIENKGLYNKSLEHSACGVGLIANIKGLKSHQIIKQGLETLRNLSHRGACGYDSETGDGAGILIQMPDKFIKMRKKLLKLSDNSHSKIVPNVFSGFCGASGG